MFLSHLLQTHPRIHRSLTSCMSMSPLESSDLQPQEATCLSFSLSLSLTLSHCLSLTTPLSILPLCQQFLCLCSCMACTPFPTSLMPASRLSRTINHSKRVQAQPGSSRSKLAMKEQDCVHALSFPICTLSFLSSLCVSHGTCTLFHVLWFPLCVLNICATFMCYLHVPPHMCSLQLEDLSATKLLLG